MPHTVLRVPSVRKTIDKAPRKLRKSYETVRDELQRDGCSAGGYRLASTTGNDYPMCCRHLYGEWRMHTVFLEDQTIVIVSVDQHTKRNNPNAALAETFSGLATTGRRSENKPPCCDDPAQPPDLDESTREVLADLFGV